MSPVIFERADYHFYAALALIGLCGQASAAEVALPARGLAAHHRQLQAWAEHCPENFAKPRRAARAEIARLEGRELDAQRLYEQAITFGSRQRPRPQRSARQRTGRPLLRARGFEDKRAGLHLRQRAHVLLALGSRRQRCATRRHVSAAQRGARAPGPTSTIGAPVEQLDLATVIKVSQAVSGEIELEKLVDTLLRTAIERAGAERSI